MSKYRVITKFGHDKMQYHLERGSALPHMMGPDGELPIYWQWVHTFSDEAKAIAAAKEAETEGVVVWQSPE